MGIGPKIKEFRNKAGLTQKDLADKLHVTYQAVSRWENDDAEPSFDMLKDMCGILNCSTDELFGVEKHDAEAAKANEEKVAVTEQKPVLAVCEKCNKPIYDGKEINRITLSNRVYSGRSSHLETRQQILCNQCNLKRLDEERRKKERLEAEKLERLKKRRIHSFVWPTIVALIFIIIGITSFVGEDTKTGIGYCVGGVFAFTFAATMILNNTFLTDMWFGIASWGFVKLPGIIFEFSIDGFIFLIAMKILFWLLGMALAVAAAVLATILSAALSIFVYPFALKRNLDGIETDI